VYYFFVAGMNFGAFARSIPKEENQELEVGETMCGEIAYYQRAYNCAHYRLLLDRVEVDEVRWSTYDDHRKMRPFQLIVTYSG
jgi:hypothetical protein